MSTTPEIDDTICVAFILGAETLYGYVPSLAAGITFCALFGISTILHIFVSIRYRIWWQLLFAVGALTEIIGWAGRMWSSDCPYENNPFLMQITTLIIAPSFFTAGIYVILGRLIQTFGPHVSPLSPRTYLYIFCTADVVSLVIQAVGGAMASIAFSEKPRGNTDDGTNIMVGGILFQLASIIVFSVLFTWVMIKTFQSRSAALQQRKIQYIVAATVFSVIVIVIRSIYRTIELLQGWEGYLITTEWFFLVFDGAMMVLAVAVFNIAQPKWAATAAKAEASITPSEMEMTDLESQDRGEEKKVQN